MISALASTLDAENDAEAKTILDDLVDPVGTFYYFSVANSWLKRSKP